MNKKGLNPVVMTAALMGLASMPPKRQPKTNFIVREEKSMEDKFPELVADRKMLNWVLKNCDVVYKEYPLFNKEEIKKVMEENK